MSLSSLSLHFSLRKRRSLLFLGSIFLWLIPFRGLLFGQVSPTDDAISYYDHTKFFIDNMFTGIFPLWDPTWLCGMANEFFLRRINPYNPFLLLIFILRLIGVSQIPAYAVFLAAYFILGMIGFYRCAKVLFKDNDTARLAFLLLLFSPVSGRIFDSYIMLVFTPLTWFFYFLLVFYQKTRPSHFAGILFSLMMLLNVYIPFYFLLIFLSFLLTLGLTYPRAIKEFFIRAFSFSRKYPALVLAGTAALAVSLLPGIILFGNAHQQQFVMPSRHRLAADPNVLAVDPQWIVGWGTFEELLYGSFFQRFDTLTFAILCVPAFIYLLLVLGTITRIQKRSLFLFLWLLGLLVITLPKALGVYAFLYQHLFFFKYFKNLQFFLWLAILPLFFLFLAGQWQQLIELRPKGLFQKAAACLFLTAAHLAVLGFFVSQGNRHVSVYLTIGLSLVFFVLLWAGILHPRQRFFYFLILALICLQPLEVFSHITRRLTKDFQQYDYSYGFRDFTRDRFQLVTHAPGLSDDGKTATPALLYVTNPLYNGLFDNISQVILGSYISHKFILYDRVAALPDGKPGFEAIIKSFAENENVAYVPRESVDQPSLASAGSPPLRPEGNSADFQIVSADPNHMHIRTNFPEKKFLVITDNWDSRWQAWVNGQKQNILPANFAFKGLWLAPGRQDLLLRFGTTKDIVFNFSLLGIFYGLLFSIFWLKHQEGKRAPRARE